MSTSPNKYAILTGIKSAIQSSATVKALCGNVHIIPREADLGPFNLGSNKAILIRDGGITRIEDSTASATYRLTVNIAAFDIKGDANRNAAASRVMAIATALGTLLDRNPSVYTSATQWIETAKLIDVEQSQEVWSDIVASATNAPFVLQPLVIEYQLYCLEV